MADRSSPGETPLHPCMACGACCAYFRVAFYWRETEEGHRVPEALAEDLGPFQKCMKGTNQKNRVQCIALRGRIGTRATCSIYANRPSPCRDFAASYADGKQNKRCDEARAAHGLRALRPEDWVPFKPPTRPSTG